MTNEERKLKSLVDPAVWELMRLCDVIIAGGAITSVHTANDVNDIDVYFRSPQHFMAFVYAAYGRSDVDIDHYQLIANFMTDRSLLMKDKTTNQEVQLIFDRFYPTVQDVFDAFDFTINMGAYLFTNGGEFILHKDFMKHNAQRYLSFNPKTSYPLMSALRVAKYAERGYTISKPQMLRVLLAVNDKQIDSWGELLKEVGGMYGLNMEDVFPTKEEFSVDKALDCLDAIYADNHTRPECSNPTLPAVYDKVKGYFEVANEEPVEKQSVYGRYFKNVVLASDGRLSSHYRQSFKYPVGEVVNGGINGLWAYAGGEVVDGMYWGEYIVELEPVNGGVFNHNKKFSGDVLVKESWKASEFLRVFDVARKSFFEEVFNLPHGLEIQITEILYPDEEE